MAKLVRKPSSTKTPAQKLGRPVPGASKPTPKMTPREKLGGMPRGAKSGCK